MSMCLHALFIPRVHGTRVRALRVWQAVAHLLNDMRASNIKPDEWTYGPLLEACRKNGQRQRARGYGRRMLVERNPSVPLSAFWCASSPHPDPDPDTGPGPDPDPCLPNPTLTLPWP